MPKRTAPGTSGRAVKQSSTASEAGGYLNVEDFLESETLDKCGPLSDDESSIMAAEVHKAEWRDDILKAIQVGTLVAKLGDGGAYPSASEGDPFEPFDGMCIERYQLLPFAQAQRLRMRYRHDRKYAQQQEKRLRKILLLHSADDAIDALSAESYLHPQAVFMAFISSNWHGQQVARKKERERISVQNRKKAMSRHTKNAQKAHSSSTEELRQNAVKNARALWKTYRSEGKKKKAVYADAAAQCGVSAGTLANWVSKEGGLNPT